MLKYWVPDHSHTNRIYLTTLKSLRREQLKMMPLKRQKLSRSLRMRVVIKMKSQRKKPRKNQRLRRVNDKYDNIIF